MKLRLNTIAAALVPVVGLSVFGSAMAANDKAAGATAGTNSAVHSNAVDASAKSGHTLSARDVRLSQFKGMSVYDKAGERIGDVNDVVVDLDSGTAQYAVVGVGGYLGLGEKLFAFPMQAFKVVAEPARSAAAPAGTMNRSDRMAGSGSPDRTDRSPGNPLDNDGVRGDKGPVGTDRTTTSASGTRATDRTATAPAITGVGAWGTAPRLRDVRLVLEGADKEKLKSARGFDEDHWPDMSNASFRQDVNRYSGANGQSSVASNAKLYRASKLIGADVEDRQDRDVGDIHDVVVDLATGKLRYAVVEFDKGWFKADKMVAVPIKALARAGDKDDSDVRIDADRSRFERAPAFARDQWPDLNRGKFRTDVDGYLSSWRGGTMDRSTASSGEQRSTTTSGTGGNR